MITALQSAQLCAKIYNQVAADWDHYWTFDNVICAHKRIGEEDTLTFMGSKLAIDWIRDAEGFPWWDDEIGFCHAGFLTDMDAVLAEISQVITLPVTIQGHSLGGARARIAAAKMIYRKQAVKRLCVFGSPKPGFANIRRLIEKSGIEHVSYRNCNDPVPLLAAILPMWEHTEDWQALSSHAAPDDLEPLRDHHITLYVKGVSE